MISTPHHPGLLQSIRQDAPKLWAAFTLAAGHGLIFIDEANDAITASNRLLLTYPDLHEMTCQIIDHWAHHRAETKTDEWTRLMGQAGTK